MNIDKFKRQHLDILRSIDLLRQLTHAVVVFNAAATAEIYALTRRAALLHSQPAHQALQAHGLRLLGHQVGENGFDSQGIYHHKQVF